MVKENTKNIIYSLTESQKKFLENNYLAIRNKIKDRILKSLLFYNFKNKSLLIDEAVGYLPFVYLEFDYKYKCEEDLKEFLALRSVYRLIDQKRMECDNQRIRRQKRMKIKRTKDSLLEKNTNYDKIDLFKIVKGYSINKARRIRSINSIIKMESKDEPKQVANDRSFDEIYWRDIREAIIKKANRKFTEETKKNQIIKTIIIEYLLPKASDEKYRQLSEIAKEYNISEGRVSQICHDKDIKDLIEEYV